MNETLTKPQNIPAESTPKKSTPRLFFWLVLPLIGLAIVVRLALNWCTYTDFLKLSRINIVGNHLMTKADIIKTARVNFNTNLLKIDLLGARERLESQPYIRAAIVSRHFPNQIDILIKERIPVCFVNINKLYLVDNEGVILPLPSANFKANLPVITGFDSDSARIKLGWRTPNRYLLEGIKLLQVAAQRTPAFYAEISEIHHLRDGEFILYTLNGGTPIFLRRGNPEKQLDILVRFQAILRDKRSLTDYQYIDLRWDKQIIAKERNS